MALDLSFAFDATKGETAETLRRKRRLAEALLGNSIGRAPQNVGEGLNAIGQAIMVRQMLGQAERGEAAGNASAANVFSSALGSGIFPSAPSAPSKVAKALSPNPSTANVGSTIDFARGEAAGGDLQPHQMALLDTIAGPESRGAYDVMYGGERFTDFSDHPRKAVPIRSGPNAGKTSSAAGKYQFLGSTWDEYRTKLGLLDFSARSQDKAAWALASDAYRDATGGDLDAVLRSGDPNAIAQVGRALAPIWTSLPGGIEQGIDSNGFVSAFMGNMGGGRPFGGVQVASLDPSAGMASADPYGAIPAVDSRGEDQLAKFRQWNSDPLGNEAANLAGIDPALAAVVRRAQEISGQRFTIGSGKRDADMQRKAVQWGWSQTMDSDHLGGGAADLWPVDANGQVVFDPQKQQQIVAAMKQAAGELGVDMEAGADWKRFKDVPHFGMIGQTPMDAPIPGQRPQQGVQVASLDPSIGMQQSAQPSPAAPSPVPAPQQTAGLMIGTPQDRVRQSTPIAGQTMPMQPPAAGVRAVPMPEAPSAQPGPQTPPQAPVQIAQAAPGQQMAPQDEAAIFGQPVQPQQIAEMQVRRLFEVMAHPFANDQMKAIAASEIERLRSSNDPMAQLALRKAQLEVQAMENPTPEQFTLGEGQTRYDSQGNVIASGGQKNDAPTIQSFYDPEGREYKAQWNRQTSQWEPVGGAKLPSGMSLRSNPDGTIELIQGAGAGQKLTEGQGKDIGYYTRGMDADSALATLDTQLTDFVQENAGKVPLGVGNYLRDPKFRQAKQAADSFLTAILRKDTGAAITSQEFDIYGPMFLPVPGDDKATIEQKRRARQVALLAIRSGLGTAEAIGEANRIALGLPEQSIGPAASPPATAPAPSGGDPELDRLLEMYGD